MGAAGSTAMERWARKERAMERARARAMGWGIAVVAGNAGLMAALGAHPFSEPMAQLGAGAMAIMLHGWAAWEIASGMRRWAKASADLAQEASAVLRDAAAKASARAAGARR